MTKPIQLENAYGLTVEDFLFFLPYSLNNRTTNLVNGELIELNDGGINITNVPNKELLIPCLKRASKSEWIQKHSEDDSIIYLAPSERDPIKANRIILEISELLGFDLGEHCAKASAKCRKAVEARKKGSDFKIEREDLEQSLYSLISNGFKIGAACAGLAVIGFLGKEWLNYESHYNDSHFVEATVQRVEANNISVYKSATRGGTYTDRPILNVKTDIGTFTLGRYYDRTVTPNLYTTFKEGQKYSFAILNRTNEDIVFANKVVEPHSKNPSPTVQQGNAQNASPKQYAERDF